MQVLAFFIEVYIFLIMLVTCVGLTVAFIVWLLYDMRKDARRKGCV